MQTDPTQALRWRGAVVAVSLIGLAVYLAYGAGPRQPRRGMGLGR